MSSQDWISVAELAERLNLDRSGLLKRVKRDGTEIRKMSLKGPYCTQRQMGAFVSKEYAERLIEHYEDVRSRTKSVGYRLANEAGTCPACGQPIEVGQSVVAIDRGQWHHARCVPVV